ncbi:MAG: hypothetical protein RI907_247 [Pseudomonadota bacterium]|jgi:hypothetical protein
MKILALALAAGAALVMAVLALQTMAPGVLPPGWARLGPSSPASGMHKCKVGAQVVYTDAPCPSGQTEHGIQAGTVNVVKGQRPSLPAPSAPASLPNARALLGDPQEPSLMDKQIERATE